MIGDGCSIQGFDRLLDKYTSIDTNVRNWRDEAWLWKQLPWSARMLSHLGVAKYSWWKERYIFPLLCKEGLDQIAKQCRFELSGAGLRDVFCRIGRFFAPFISEKKGLFTESGLHFLSERCDVAKLCKETKLTENFTVQRERKDQNDTGSKEHHSHVGASQIPLEDRMTEETKHRIRSLQEEFASVRKFLEESSLSVSKIVQRAFPFRSEIPEEMEYLRLLQSEVESSLCMIDEGIVQLSRVQVLLWSDGEARKLLSREQTILIECRRAAETLGTRIEQEKKRIEAARGSLLGRLHEIVRTIDRHSLLDQENPLYENQSRIIRGIRENIKKFRSSLSKGPGPSQTLYELECAVSKGLDLSERFREEGVHISHTKDQLFRLQSAVQEIVRRTEDEKKLVKLRYLLDEIAQCVVEVGILADRDNTINRLTKEIEKIK